MTNFPSAAPKSARIPTSRTFGDRPADIVNVKDHGAYGDGSHDDAGAIQAAFDAAFGSSGSPHGNNTKANRPVFFPTGHYLVGTPLTLTSVSNGYIFGAGSHSTALTFIGNVPPNAVFTVTIASAAVFTSNNHGYSAGSPIMFQTTGSLPTGLSPSTTYYVISAGLTANNFEVSTTPGGSPVDTSGSQSGTHTFLTSLIRTNGMNFSAIEALTLEISGPDTVCLNLDYVSGPINVNGNVMVDVVTKNATCGCLMGLSGRMGSEMVFIDCEFNNHSHAGVKTCNGNALMGQVYNCTFRRCSVAPTSAFAWHTGGAAIYASTGSIQVIVGCTFENSGNVDIFTSGGEGQIIVGCHSTNFLSANGSHGPMFGFLTTSTYIRGCSHSGSAANHYITWQTGSVIHDGCGYPNGRFVEAGSTNLYLRGCTLGDPNALTGYLGTVQENI